MNDQFHTNYYHASGSIVISRGLGGKGDPYYAMIRKSNGSLKRYRGIPGGKTVDIVRRQLREHTGKALRKVK